MNKWIKVATIAGTAVLTGSLYFTGVSWAQSANPPTPAATVANSAPAEWASAGQGWAKHALFRREEKIAILAEALGMKVEAVQQALMNGQKPRELIQAHGFTRETFHAALVKVAEKHLQQAVTDGRITQRQAERMRQRLTTGSGFWQRGAGQGAGRAGLRAERQAILAETLGLTPEALQQALAAGQTPRQLAQTKGLDEAALRSALQQTAEKHIQQALQAGRITQRQAERMRARLNDQRQPWLHSE